MRFSYEGDPVTAVGFLGAAQQELERLQVRMDLAGRTQGTFNLPLSDSAYCYGYILPNGIKMAHIVAAPVIDQVTGKPLLRSSLPDFISGVILDGYINRGDAKHPPTLSTLYPTNPAIQMHPKELHGGANTSERLAVLLAAGTDEALAAPPGSPLLYSQYTKLKAGMFSGRMREVVQLLMGFGRRPKTSIYDNVKPLLDIEKRGAVTSTTEYEKTVRAQGLQIVYDYRFARTHGVVPDQEGHFWLIEIGLNRGVVAMPLPINPYTQDPKFEQKLIALGDIDAERAVLDFGGFPTGEAFPAVPATFDAYVRAGRIIRIAPASSLTPFYDHIAYSQSLGWCFNYSGTEAHNTCHDFDSQGVQVGFHYAINLSLNGAADPPPTAAQVKLAKKLKARFAPLAGKPANVDTFGAAMWKIDRLTVAQINEWLSTIASAGTLQNAYDQFNALVLTPLGSGSAPLSLSEQGAIWWPNKFPPQIKFPEYAVGFLISHDMRTDFRFLAVGPRCDTTMHVWFVGDQLKWCKYFHDPRTATTRVTGDDAFDIAWNPEGDFNRETTVGPFGIPAQFYTNDFDVRGEYGPSSTSERWKRRDQGWVAVLAGGVGLVGPVGIDNQAGPLDPDFPEGGAFEEHKKQSSKYKAYVYEGWSDTVSSPSVAGAVAVPFFDRCACYFAKMEGNGGTHSQYTYSHGFLSSPWIGHYYESTDEFGIASTFRSLFEDEPQYHTIVDGSKPYQHFQDLADEGDWVPHGTPHNAAEYGRETVDMLAAQNFETFSDAPAEKTLTVNLIRGTPDAEPVQTYTETRVGATASLWESAWFIPSPDPDTGLTAYIHAVENCYGDGDVVSCMATLNSGPVKVFGSPNTPELGADGPPNGVNNPNFIGVIDG